MSIIDILPYFSIILMPWRSRFLLPDPLRLPNGFLPPNTTPARRTSVVLGSLHGISNVHGPYTKLEGPDSLHYYLSHNLHRSQNLHYPPVSPVEG